MSTGRPSTASKSIGFFRRARRPNGFLRSRKRACGIATPLPIPVDPSSSRFRTAFATRSGASRRLAAARRESSPSSWTLSSARVSTIASFGERKSLMFICDPKQADGRCSGRRATTLRFWHSVRGAQPVTDAGFGQDVLGTVWLGLDLLPQLADIDAQVLRVGQRIPQLTKQEFVRQNLAGVLDQDAQQFVFLGSEPHLGATHLDDAPHKVDRQIADTEYRPLAVDLKLMAHRGAHAGEQLLHAEGLGNVIVCAEVERSDLGALVPPAGKHDDGDALVAPADHAQELKALYVREAEIENDHIRLPGEELERGLAVGRLQNLITLRAQAHAQQLADRRFVIDDQNPEGGGVHAAVSSRVDSAGTGSRIVNTAPGRSLRFPANIVPCMASTKPLAIARPRPVPART